MVTTHTAARTASVLAVVFFATPAWAEGDDRAGCLPLQGPQLGALLEGSSHGVEPITTSRDGLWSGSHKTGKLHLGSVGGRLAGSRPTSWPSDFHGRPGEIPMHDGGEAGIPLWRW